MRPGRYKPFDWTLRQAYNFKINGPSFDDSLRGSCGTFALACITGIEPKIIDKSLPKKVDHWSERRIISYLKKLGFEAIHITVGLVTNKESCTVNNYHVILTGQEVYKEIGTYGVVWNGHYYHSGEISRVKPLEFISNPIDFAYLIWHPKWEVTNPDVISARKDFSKLCDGYDKYIGLLKAAIESGSS